MREIKFRGKRIDNGQWVYGQLLQERNNTFISASRTVHFEVIPETVGQYIGLKDSLKKEIYEGDLVKDKETVFQVNWHVQQSCFWLTPNTSLINEDWILMAMNNQRLGNGYYSRKDIEIIGNIHENTKLLK